MRRLLFVDDESRILDGLRRSLRSLRSEWEMVFAEGGAQAIEEAEKEPFEVVVSDMRMPGMDGAELLSWFHKNQPETIRFVLSGHAETESIMRAVPIAHQFLSKPCDASTLKDVVTRAFELQEVLADPVAQSLIGEMKGLPSRPSTYTAVIESLSDPEVEVSQISKIIAADTAMSLKVLQLVNSAFFGVQQSINDVNRATNFLGLDTIRDLVLSVEVFKPPADCGKQVEDFLDALQKRSTWTGAVAKRMCPDKKSAELAFTAGVLHDIGMLVLAARFPEKYAAVFSEASEGERPFSEIERETFGVGHDTIGAYLLGLWGLPYPILDIAARHDRPATGNDTGRFELTAVHVASALVESALAEQGQPYAWLRSVDMEYLESVKMVDRMPEWEALVTTDRAQQEEEGAEE